LFGVVD